MNLILEHYSNLNLVVPHDVAQNPRDNFKPQGLWVSVKGEDDWPSWCAREDFGCGAICHRVELKPTARVLILSTPECLDIFDRMYGDGQQMIRWQEVAAEHAGLIITPYQWSRRFSHLWYYGWDCASGCIWDASAIQSITRT